MRRQAGEQCASALVAKISLSETTCRLDRLHAEAGKFEKPARDSERTEEIAAQSIPMNDKRIENFG